MRKVRPGQSEIGIGTNGGRTTPISRERQKIWEASGHVLDISQTYPLD